MQPVNEMDVVEQGGSSSPVAVRGGGKKKDRGDSADAASPTMTRGNAAGSTHQARSRITLVCQECKRLKLRCDRRTPCDQCIKRNSETKCIYSQQAAEKVDVQSLHNRMLILESFCRRAEARLSLLPPGGPYTLRSLTALGQGGSSISVNLDDVSSLWLEHLDLTKEGIDVKALIASVLLPARGNIPGPGNDVNWLDGMVSNLALFKVSVPASDNTPSPSAHSASAMEIGISPELVSQLPAEPARSALLERLEATLRMHPCIPFPHFRQRIDGMFRWAERNSRASPFSFSSSMGDDDARPSLSFFAAVALGFAIGAASWLEANNNSLTTGGSSSINDAPDHISVASSSPARSRKGKSAVPLPPPSTITTSSTSTSASSTFTGPLDPSLPMSLASLSETALWLHEKKFEYASHDLNYVSTLLLRIIYLAYSPSWNNVDGLLGSGTFVRPEISSELYPLLGKLVNVSQMMGLHHDPDDVQDGSSVIAAQHQTRVKTEDGFPERDRFTIFEKELRRRLWSAVYYWDVFISDALGHPPQILDDHVTTHEPVDLDDEAFDNDMNSPAVPRYDDIGGDNGNLGWLLVRGSLARLVKTIKKRSYRDPTIEDADRDKQTEFTIDKAHILEREIHMWLDELPHHYRLRLNPDISNLGRLDEEVFQVAEVFEEVVEEDEDMDADIQPSVSGRGPRPMKPASSFLVAQRAELAMIAHRLIIGLFMPFLRASTTTATNVGSLNPAILSEVTAAHAVIYAARVMQTAIAPASVRSARAIRPPISIYSYAKGVFDAAVISAHTILQNPRNVTSRTSGENLVAAMTLLRNSGLGGTVEAMKVLELLKAKVDIVKGAASNSKRKYEEVDAPTFGDMLGSGFQLPFVGPSVGFSLGDGAARGFGHERTPGPSGAMTSVPDNDSVASSRHAKSEQIGRSNRAKYNNKHAGDFIESRSVKSGGSRKTTGSRAGGSTRGHGHGKKDVAAPATNGPALGIRKRDEKEREEREEREKKQLEKTEESERTRSRAASISVVGTSTGVMLPPPVVPSSHEQGRTEGEREVIFRAPLTAPAHTHGTSQHHPSLAHSGGPPTPVMFSGPYNEDVRGPLSAAPYEQNAFERSMPNRPPSAYEAYNSQGPSQPSPQNASFYPQSHAPSPTVYSPSGPPGMEHYGHGGMAVPMPMGPPPMDHASPVAPVPPQQIYEHRFSVSSDSSFTPPDRLPSHRSDHQEPMQPLPPQHSQPHLQLQFQQQQPQHFQPDLTSAPSNHGAGPSSGSQSNPQQLAWSHSNVVQFGTPPTWEAGTPNPANTGLSFTDLMRSNTVP